MSQSQRATSFDVKVNAAKPDTQVARAANLSRLTIDKRFHGDLEGISKGECWRCRPRPGLRRPCRSSGLPARSRAATAASCRSTAPP